MNLEELIRILKIAGEVCSRHGEHRDDRFLVEEVARAIIDALIDSGAWAAFEDKHPRDAANLLRATGMNPDIYLDPVNRPRAR